MDQHKHDDHLTIEGAQTKGSSSFVNSKPGGQLKGRARNRKVLSEWEKKNIFKISPYSPHKEATVEVPEEDFGQRPQIKIFSNEGTWVRNVNMRKRITGQKGLSP